MAETRRWDGDETGRGIAGAGHLSGPVDALRATMDQPEWVSDAGELVVTVEVAHVAEDRPKADVRSVAYRLLGTFAEPSTFVEERPVEGGAEFVVVTGLLEGQTRFLPHGHTVRLVIRPSDTLSNDGS